MTDTYRKCICEMVEKIDNEKFLKRIYLLVQYLYCGDSCKESENSKAPVHTKEHKQLFDKIQKVRNMEIHKYTLYTDDIDMIRELAANDLFTIMSYTFNYGFYQAMQYMKNKKKRVSQKKPNPGSRAYKIQELLRMVENIPDKRLEALLCWAKQYQEV